MLPDDSQSLPRAKSPDVPIGHHATEFLDAGAALELEDTLWWWQGRQAILDRYLRRAGRDRPLRRILEIGCGSGVHLELLARYGDVVAVESSEALAARARSRRVAKDVVVGDVFETSLVGEADLICLFDVLEHIGEDEGFLQRLRSAGEPGHLLLLSVPACPFLFGPHDVLLHHHRRYTWAALEDRLQRSGYETIAASHYLFFVFPFAALWRLGERLRAALGRPPRTVKLGVVPGWLNWLLKRALILEGQLSRYVTLPWGVWLIALARAR